VQAAPQPQAAAPDVIDSLPILRVIAAGAQTNSAHAEGGLVAVAGFAFTLLIVLALMAFRRAQEHERYETMRRLIEKGAEIPKELLGAVAKEGSDLRRGVVFISLGVGLIVFIMSGAGWGLGALFICIGIGYLLSGRMEKKKA
jgi:predicted PurR-regulated permease PerM